MRRSIAVAALAAAFACATVEAARAPINTTGPANLDLSYPSETVAEARYGADSNLLARRNLIGQLRQTRSGHPSEFDARLGSSTFLWAPAGLKTVAPLTLNRKSLIEFSGRNALSRQAYLLGLSAKDIADAKLTQIHDLGSGALIASFQQRLGGLEVFGRNLAVAMRQDLSVVATSGYFAAVSDDLRNRAAAQDFSLPATRALTLAFADLGGSIAESQLSALSVAGDYTRYSVAATGRDYRIQGTPRSKRVRFPIDGDLVPAYYLEIEGTTADGHRDDAYAYVVSAVDGRVLFRRNMTQHESFSYRVMAASDGIHQPYDHPLGNDYAPVPSLDPNATYVRTPAVPNLVTLQSSPQISTGDPWLASTATQTVGNNADAYVDLAFPDGYTPLRGDFRASVNSTRTFDYPVAVDTSPTTSAARSASIVNLFYMNNFLHDTWYDVGFNEAAGNAQTNNYGRGGAANDPILAQGQDYSGTNNANMSTPADGSSPRMQMYLFDGIFNGSLTITQPALGDLSVAPAGFGATTFNLTANVVGYTDATGTVTDGCEAATNASALAGKIALIDRGNCDFVAKVKNAQNAGAAGAIIADNVAGEKPFTMGGTDASITIPSLMTSFEDGGRVRTALASGPVTAHMVRNASIPLDGTTDNGIITHEFFHYVSNRLVNNGSGLSNNQGGSMGEGWSDFGALLLMVRPEDRNVANNTQFQGPYSMGYYVLDDEYFGIRRAPYSTDFAVNPLTFGYIENGRPLPTTAPFSFGQDGASNAEVHNAGEIWAVTLWDAYVALLNDPRYDFDTAKRHMQSYIIGGLKMTPTSPTFTEARDGILATALASDEGDFDLINAAFAKRGMGIYALSPPRNSTTNQAIVESFVSQAMPVTAAASFNLSTLPTCDGDDIIDNGETGTFVVTLPVGDSSALADGTTAVVTEAGSSVFSIANGGSMTLSPIGGGYLRGSVQVTLSGASPSQQVSLRVALPELGANVYAQFPSGVATGNEATDHFVATVNYDLVPNARAVDDVEQPAASVKDWSVDRTGNTSPWQIVDYNSATSAGLSWWAPSSDQLSETTLTSPPIQVTTLGNFTFSFVHYFAFSEATGGVSKTGPDGGVIEVSVNGGSWTDVTQVASFSSGAYNGTLLTPSGSRPGYVDTGLAQVALDFGSNVAGSTIRLRLHQYSNEGVGNFGWLVDYLTAGSAATPPFSSVLAENGTCTASAAPVATSSIVTARPAATTAKTAPSRESVAVTRQIGQAVLKSSARAGNDLTAVLGSKVLLDASASLGTDAGIDRYRWAQTAGPDVTLLSGNTALASFTPTVTGRYAFTLTVTDKLGRMTQDAMSVVITARH